MNADRFSIYELQNHYSRYFCLHPVILSAAFWREESCVFLPAQCCFSNYEKTKLLQIENRIS